MTKSLILVRHAHSIHLQPGIKDIDRTLTEKGVQDSYKVGKYLNNMKLRPELIYTSHAARAIATAQLIAEQTGIGSREIVIHEELFEASLRILLRNINQIENKYQWILVIGHNPSISFLCEFLTESTVSELNPGGMCLIQFNNLSWDKINKATGALMDFKSPEEIII